MTTTVDNILDFASNVMETVTAALVTVGGPPATATVESGDNLITFLNRVGAPYSDKQTYISDTGKRLGPDDSMQGVKTVTATTTVANG